jgi:hypothetical protein
LTFCIPFLLVLRLYMYIFCRPVTWTWLAGPLQNSRWHLWWFTLPPWRPG